MTTSDTPYVSIIIPTKNQRDLLERLLKGLEDTARTFNKPIEVVIVDNNSDDSALLAYFDSLPRAAADSGLLTRVVRYPHRFNYSKMNNLAVASCASEFLCFLNNDIEVIDSGWLAAMLDAQEKYSAACVGALLYYPDNTIQHAGVYLHPDDVAGHVYKYETSDKTGINDYLLNVQELEAVTAACMLVPRSRFDQVGGFNESLAITFNDVDFCLKLRAAELNIVWTPHAKLYHHESKSRGQKQQRTWLQKLIHKRAVWYMKRTWRDRLSADTTFATHVKPETATSSASRISTEHNEL